MIKMKKRLLTVALLMGVVAVGCTAIGKKLEQVFAIQPNYYTQTQTNYPIERQYTGMGKYAVQSQVSQVMTLALNLIKFGILPISRKAPSHFL